MLLVGPAQAGKSTWLLKLIENLDRIHTTTIGRVLFCYDQWHSLYDRMRAVCPRPDCLEFIRGLPDSLLATRETNNQQNDGNAAMAELPNDILIMDDLMLKLDMMRIAHLFTNGRYLGLNPILVLHNLTHKGRNATNALTTINRNCSYRVLFSIPSDLHNIRTLQSQMFPHRPQFLMDIYQDACARRPYGYLILDSRPSADNNLRAYTRIWPDEAPAEFYLPPDFNQTMLTIPGGQLAKVEYNL